MSFHDDSEEAAAIPAASIGETDLEALALSNPEAALEIARLTELMNLGEESPAEFLRLCELLFDVGSVAAAEYLLRRNVDFYGGHDLYARLFGDAKRREFEAAIAAFRSQFGVELTWVAEPEFLVAAYRSVGGLPRADAFRLLSEPFGVKFSYAEPAVIEATAESLDSSAGDDREVDPLWLGFDGARWVPFDPSVD